MEETSKPQTRKKSGWSTDPPDRIGAEVWRQMYELTVDRRSECNEHGSCQALSPAALSTVAQQAQSCHLAFKFFFSSPYMFMPFLGDYCRLGYILLLAMQEVSMRSR